IDAARRSPRQLLHDWYSMVDVARSAHLAGARVSAILMCPEEAMFTEEGVDYLFFTPPAGERVIARSARFRDLLRGLRPDVFHVHGFVFPEEVLELSRCMPDVPIYLQPHGEVVPRFWKRRA